MGNEGDNQQTVRHGLFIYTSKQKAQTNHCETLWDA